MNQRIAQVANGGCRAEIRMDILALCGLQYATDGLLYHTLTAICAKSARLPPLLARVGIQLDVSDDITK
jgi:hypothetical protein